MRVYWKLLTMVFEKKIVDAPSERNYAFMSFKKRFLDIKIMKVFIVQIFLKPSIHTLLTHFKPKRKTYRISQK